MKASPKKSSKKLITNLKQPVLNDIDEIQLRAADAGTHSISAALMIKLSKICNDEFITQNQLLRENRKSSYKTLYSFSESEEEQDIHQSSQHENDKETSKQEELVVMTTERNVDSKEVEITLCPEHHQQKKVNDYEHIAIVDTPRCNN